MLDVDFALSGPPRRRLRLLAAFFLLLVGFAVAGPASAQPAADQVADQPQRLTSRQCYQRLLDSTAWIVIQAPRAKQATIGSRWLLDRSRKLLVTNHHVVTECSRYVPDRHLNVFFPQRRPTGRGRVELGGDPSGNLFRPPRTLGTTAGISLRSFRPTPLTTVILLMNRFGLRRSASPRSGSDRSRGGQPRRLSLLIIGFVSFGLTFGAVREGEAQQSSERPNVLLIVSDDQGYNDLGLLGNGILTPNLDRLANEGTRLTSFYVTWPACTPSRASLLTGRYPQRNGIYDMIRNEAPDYGHRYTAAEYAVTFERIGGMDLREVLLPEVLGEAGYRSGIYGKWDLGSLRRFLPTSRGFDDFYGFVNTGIDYYTHERYGVPSMYRDLSPTEEDRGTYCTYLFEREALRFVEQHAGRRPFFLYVPFNAPHGSSALDPEIRTTVQAPRRFKAMYPPVEPETRHVESYRYRSPATVTTRQARTRDYRAAVTCMDASIGKLLDRLKERGVLDNTIVIFLSDNGGGGGSDNAPLRGGKSTMWEGGLRVPCLIRWPAGGVPAGAVSDAFLTSLEIFPSLVEATGASPPQDVVLDGFDWWPVIRGERPSPRNEMFWRRKDLVAARVGDWKWVEMGERGSGLFNLAEDISESHDLSDSHPEQLHQVKRRYQAWREEMDAAEPRGPFRDF